MIRIRAPAKALNRDLSNIHADVRTDVQALAATLLQFLSRGIRVDYDAIETRIAL